MIFRALDIETIPDATVWTPGEEQWQLVPGPTRRLDGAWTVCLEKKDPFPPPQAHRVVAIAWVDIAMDINYSPRYQLKNIQTACHWDWDVKERLAGGFEKAMLQEFSENMTGQGIDLVTWNGRGFDLPVLAMRSFKYGIPFGWYYENRDMRYRFSENGHLDLMDFLGDYGAGRNMKLGDVARLIGLPGKTDMTGASVHEIVKTSRVHPETAVELMDRVSKYCLQDAIQTALIFLRSQFHLGRIDATEYNGCLNTFIRNANIEAAISINWDKLKL
jgi:hypothetical protein